MKAARVVRTGGRPKRTCTRRHLAGGRPVCKSLLVRGLNALAAIISTPLAAPVIAATRLRGGNANSARGAASLAAEAISTARAGRMHRPAGVPDRLGVLLRRGAAGAIRRGGACFSVTVPMDPKIRAAIAAIREVSLDPDHLPAGDLG